MLYCLSTLFGKRLFYSGHRSDKLNVNIVMISAERSSKIVNFMTPGAEVLVLGHGHELYSEIGLFL